MTSGWQTKDIGDVCTLKPPKREARAVLDLKDLVSFVPMEDLPIGSKKLLPSIQRPLSEVVGGYTYFADGDVLLAKITPCFENGKLGIACQLKNGIGFGSSEYIVLRANSSVSNEWLYYYLARESFRREGASRMTGAVGHKRVPQDFVTQYPIPVPPISEQKRIVRILDRAVEGIARAKVNAAMNERNAEALFASFLNKSLAGIRADSRVTTVGDLVLEGVLAKPQDGNHGEIHPTKVDYVAQGVPFLMAADLKGGVVDTISCRFISDLQARALRIGFAKNGDVLLSHKGTIGRVAMLLTDRAFAVLTPQVTYYRILDGTKLLNQYLYYYFQSELFQKELIRIAGAGSTRAYIGITRQLALEILIPPMDEQRLLVTRLAAAESAGARLKGISDREITALDELRESVISRAFLGQLSQSA